jgi:TonB family protein
MNRTVLLWMLSLSAAIAYPVLGGQLVYEQSDIDKVPRILHSVVPPYTSEAMKHRIEGAVLVGCVVTDRGTTVEVHVIRSLDSQYGLDEEAVKAATQWTFTPAEKDSHAVPVRATIEFHFTLHK